MLKDYEYQSDFARTYVAEGRAKGLLEGLLEGELKLLIRQLERRLARTLSPQEQARLAACVKEQGAEHIQDLVLDLSPEALASDEVMGSADGSAIAGAALLAVAATIRPCAFTGFGRDRWIVTPSPTPKRATQRRPAATYDGERGRRGAPGMIAVAAIMSACEIESSRPED